MPTTNTETFLYDAGRVCNNAFETRLADVKAGYTIGAVALSNRYGFRCLQWTSTKGAIVQNYYYIYAMLAAAELGQARYIMSNPSWQNSVQGTYGGPAPFTTWAQMQTFWQQNCIALKQAVIDTWTTSFISSQIVHSINYGGDKVRVASAGYQVTTDSDCLIDVANLYATNIGGASGYFLQPPPTGPGPLSSPTLLQDPVTQARIAAALEEIAEQDYEISLNHGQSIFSVKGRVIT